MPIQPPVLLLIAVIALVVASIVAQRAGAHADHQAGRRRLRDAHRSGPLGAVVDLLDQSVAAYTIRSKLGLSTLTRVERRAAEQRAGRVAHADEIRRLKGTPPAIAPTRIVVAGPAAARQSATNEPLRSSVSVELLAAGLGLAVVIGIVIGIWPRERGDVAGTTGTPAPTVVSSPSPTALPTLPG